MLGAYALASAPFADVGGVSAYAAGSVSTIDLSAFAGSAIVSISASGDCSTVALKFDTTALASAGSLAEFALGGMPLGGGGVRLPVQQAAGTALASGQSNSIIISSQTASATGTATASGASNNLVISKQLGSGSGSASASGLFNTIAISTVQSGTATGSASASGLSNSIVIVKQDGSGSGSATTSGSIGSITIQPVAGSAFGSAVANSDMTFVAIVHQDVSAKAFNPPSWARARISEITNSNASVKKIGFTNRIVAQSYVKINNTARIANTIVPIN